jgi:hypothetical protein
MARIPPNRRYEALRRSLTWAEPGENSVIRVEPWLVRPPPPPSFLPFRTSLEIAGLLVVGILPAVLVIALATIAASVSTKGRPPTPNLEVLPTQGAHSVGGDMLEKVGGGALEESLSPSPAPSVWVARVRARVRAGPGTTYPILRVLRPGEPVIEQARVRIGEEEWLHVRLSDGTTGWVRSDLLKRP